MTDHVNDSTEADRGQEFPIGLVITGILAAIIVIFIVSNNHDVPVKFLGWNLTVPMWSIVFIATFFGAALAMTLTAIRRRGKRRQGAV
jgi:uncharacterized integral membrane protein